MEDLAEIQQEEKPRITYQKWALRFFIYYLITWVGRIIFVVINFYPFNAFPSPSPDFTAVKSRITAFSIIALLTTLACIFCLIRSYGKREQKTFRRNIALYGIITVAVIQVLLPFLAILGIDYISTLPSIPSIY